jgi:hypothetical protein
MDAETILLICLIIVTAFLVLRRLEELVFFWKSGWDFTLTHGMNFSFGVEGETNNPVTNRTKLFVAYPLMILVFTVFGLVTYLFR